MASLADTLTAAGIGWPDTVVAECERYGVPVAAVCVLLVKETGGGANVYGHDAGACMTVPGERVQVTEANYQAYLACVAAGGKRNGVGPMQLTYRGYQERADQLGGCWRPEVNIRVGVEAFAAHLKSTRDLWESFRRYNGAASYADDAVARMPHWLDVTGEHMPTLVIQTGHVGRPPCPGSQGTAGEQTFTKRAGEACARLLNREGWVVNVIDADPNYSAHPSLGGDPNAYKGDAFVAVHCDGSENPDRDGASFGYLPGGRGFAADIKAAYIRRTNRPATWCEPDNYTGNLAGYYGNNLATSVGNTRAVIFECGFLTNPNDRDMLLAPTGPDNVALAIGDALGMHLQEATIMGDMDWGDRLDPTSVAVENYPLSAAVVIRGAYDWGGLNGGKITALGPPVARIESKVDQLLALHGGTASFDEAMAEIKKASVEAAAAASADAVEALKAELLPAVREALRAELGEDNEQQTEAVLGRIADKLRAA